MTAKTFTHIMHNCRERLGIDIAELVRTPGTGRSTGGLLGELVDLLNTFDKFDCAFVVGAAKALHDYKYGVDKEKSLHSNLEELVGWWLEQKRKSSEKKHKKALNSAKTGAGAGAGTGS